jgi:hypothetical protein
MKPTAWTLLTLAIVGIVLAAFLGYVAYCLWTHKPIPWYLRFGAPVAALVFAFAGRFVRMPRRD